MEESKMKYIIVNRGRSQQGKTPSIRKVYELFKEKQYITIDDVNNGDIKAIAIIGNSKVGIESLGDPDCGMEEVMDEFVAAGCNIILTACRPVGPTYDKVFELRRHYGYEIILDMNPRPYYYQRYTKIDNATLDMMNNLYAEQTAQLIEYLARK